MTHLPEVEVIRKDLEREIVGKRIKDVTVKAAALVRRHRNRPEFYKTLLGRKITGVSRRATNLLIELDNATVLVLLLGPNAHLSRETATAEPERSTQLVATFTTGGSLHYREPDAEGEFFTVNANELAAVKELAAPGRDPLAETFTWHELGEELMRRQVPLKTLLIDPEVFVGLGDLYADEVLWTAGLAGTRSSETLSAQEVRRLYRAVFEVLNEAVKQGGAGEAEPVPEEDEEHGEYSDFLNVYGREGQPCARCRQPVHKASVAPELETFYCPQCQS